MEALLLRIVLTPLVYLLVTVAQARFGPGIGGRLIGLPLTTGPFLVIVCATDGVRDAGVAAAGVVGGQLAVVAFCAAYPHLGRHLAPEVASAAALVCSLVPVAFLGPRLGLRWSAVLVWLAIAVSLAAWPARTSNPGDRTTADATSPVGGGTLRRAAASTGVVALMSASVPVLGASVAGVLSAAPILLTLLVPRVHRTSGADAAASIARGTVVSMTATVAFSVTLAATLPRMGATRSFVLATAVLVAVTVAVTVAVQISQGALGARRRSEPPRLDAAAPLTSSSCSCPSCPSSSSPRSPTPIPTPRRRQPAPGPVKTSARRS